MKLSALTAVLGRRWIVPGEGLGDIGFQVEPFGDAYADAQAAAHRALALPHGGDQSKVPAAEIRRANLECIFAHCAHDIRNLEGADGAPVTWDAVQRMAFQPEYKPLADGIFAAVAIATRQRAADVGAAVGNSAAPSAST